MPSDRPDPPLPAALRLVVLVWGVELILARLSSDAQDPLDLLKSLGVLAAGGVLPVLGMKGRTGRRWALLRVPPAVLPLAAVAAGILGAPAMRVQPLLGPVLAAALLAGFLAWRFTVAWRGGSPFPAPGAAAVLLFLAALAGWWMLRGALPPALILGPFAALTTLMALLVRSRPGIAAAALLAAGTALCPAPVPVPAWRNSRPPAAGPDIVLLCVDTLRADAARSMQSFGRLAAEGAVFGQAQAAAPWTLPSMATVMTGLPVWSHAAGSGAGRRYVGLADETPTLAERLQAAGYDTAAVVHNPVLSRASGFDRGFDLFEDASDAARWSLPRTRSTQEARPIAAHLLALARLAGRRLFFDAGRLAERAAGIIAARRERPLLLWVHFLDCHFPYRRADELPLPWRERMTLERGKAELYRADAWWRGAEGRAALRSGYDHELAAVDRALGRILDALGPPPSRGRIVVLFSDHGEEFFEHGGVEHGHSFWQEVVAIPLVVTGLPGLEAGLVIEEPVSHLDLAATLLRAAGLPAADLPGRHLAAPLGTEALLCQNLLHYRESPEEAFSVRRGRLKAIYGPAGRVRLFDLESDPGERHDLAGDPAYAAFLSANAALPETLQRSNREQAPDAEMMEGLQAIGYVGGTAALPEEEHR